MYAFCKKLLNFYDLRTFDAKFCRENSRTFSTDFFGLKSKIRRNFYFLDVYLKWTKFVRCHCSSLQSGASGRCTKFVHCTCYPSPSRESWYLCATACQVQKLQINNGRVLIFSSSKWWTSLLFQCYNQECFGPLPLLCVFAIWMLAEMASFWLWLSLRKCAKWACSFVFHIIKEINGIHKFVDRNIARIIFKKKNMTIVGLF